MNSSFRESLIAALVLAAVLIGAATASGDPVELTIVHFNDLDRMEESQGKAGSRALPRSSRPSARAVSTCW